MASSPPTTEQGVVSTAFGVMPWSTFLSYIDTDEYVPELMWPRSTATYEMMGNDTQVRGLLSGTTLPITRFKWMIDRNGAPEAMADEIARNLSLPIKGKKDDGPRPRIGNRFSFGRHLRDALRALQFGHYYFEQVGAVTSDPLRWHIKKLAPRPPKTIAEINVDKDGGLREIKQAVGPNPPTISVDNLVAYIWDMEGANWVGKSMLRPLFRNWLIKDTLIRVDAVKHERNGVGMPIIEAFQGATHDELLSLSDMAQKFRFGEEGGGATPYGSKLRLVGTEGTLPDTVASLNYHDQQMAKAFLMMFVELGQTQTGSRALGESFLDYFSYAQEAIADWFTDVFNEHVIEDWVDWNYGEEQEEVPKLIYSREEDEELPTADLAALVDKGVVKVDPELEDFIRSRHNLPEADRSQANPIPPPAPPEPSPVAPPAPAQARTGEGRRVVRGAVVGDAPSSHLPARPRRQPYAHEVQAATNFAILEAKLNESVGSLFARVRSLQTEQYAELHDAIVAAGGDVKKIAAIQATPIDSGPVLEQLLSLAETGFNEAIAEAEAQGVDVTRPAISNLTAGLEARAKGMARVWAEGLADIARRKAILLTGGSLTPEEVAASVKSHLEGLVHANLEASINGVVTQAMNDGRKIVMGRNKPADIYASELLDERCCDTCVSIDGTHYLSMFDAEADYPGGGFADCLGGPRCRGTLVAVYEGG